MSEKLETTLIEQLQQALGFVPGTALAIEIGECLIKLGKTKDLNWIDLMVWRLTEEGVPLPEAIQDLAARAAYQRLHGAGKRGGEPTKVMKDHTKEVVHANAAFLQGALGMSRWEAYVNAANAVGDEAGWAGRASTPYNERSAYAAEGPVADMLTEIGAAWAQYAPEQLAALKDHLEKVPKRKPGSPRGEHYPAK
jgi:hypothetical protein